MSNLEIHISIDQYREEREHEDEVDKFICPIFNLIAWKPLLCTNCNSVYCTQCVDDSNKCTKESCNQLVLENNVVVERILSGFRFLCPNDCRECVLYRDYENHLKQFCKLAGKEKNDDNKNKGDKKNCIVC